MHEMRQYHQIFDLRQRFFVWKFHRSQQQQLHQFHSYHIIHRRTPNETCMLTWWLINMYVSEGKKVELSAHTNNNK